MISIILFLFAILIIILFVSLFIYENVHSSRKAKKVFTYIERHKMYDTLNSCKTPQQLHHSLDWALRIIREKKRLNEYEFGEKNEFDILRERIYNIYYLKLEEFKPNYIKNENN